MLAAVNQLFEGEFGDGFQPLAASGEFPDPVFGHPVELLVTDKSAYADTGTHWRRAEARHIARRVLELVDTGAAAPGEIVLLFAAGTDAEWYEEELRARRPADLPRDRTRLLRPAAGRRPALVPAAAAQPLRRPGSRHRARLALRRRLQRRARAPAPRRQPAAALLGLERDLPPDLDERDARLLRAFKQRYERLVAASTRLSLERLCEAIVAEHDYDLAVLARWDGKRRYANLRKLARLARSYEELRGADIEGFVRFVLQQEAVGAKELEAVAEEEGADAVRLLTIHSAKGLEFKVVIVADAGRDRAAPASDEILALSDGRFGFRVADPSRARARRVRLGGGARRAAPRGRGRAPAPLLRRDDARDRPADRLRRDRPGRRAERSTPMGWVLDRLGAGDELADGRPAGRARARRRPLPRASTGSLRTAARGRSRAGAGEAGPARALRGAADDGGSARTHAARARAGARSAAAPGAPALVHGFRRCSSAARTGTTRNASSGCASAMRVHMGPAVEGLGATEIGERGAHRARAARPHRSARSRRPRGAGARRVAGGDRREPRADPRARDRVLRPSSPPASRAPGRGIRRHFTFLHDGVLLHGYLDVFHADGSRALVVDYKTNLLDDLEPAAVVESDYRLQRLVYALGVPANGRGGGRGRLPVPRAARGAGLPVFARAEIPTLEAELSAAIERIQAGDFRPTPSESACTGCPRSTSSAQDRGSTALRGSPQQLR